MHDGYLLPYSLHQLGPTLQVAGRPTAFSCIDHIYPQRPLQAEVELSEEMKGDDLARRFQQMLKAFTANDLTYLYWESFEIVSQDLMKQAQSLHSRLTTS